MHTVLLNIVILNITHASYNGIKSVLMDILDERMLSHIGILRLLVVEQVHKSKN